MASSETKSKEDTATDLIQDEPVNEEPQDINVESVSPELFVEPSMKVMPTLPESFKSLVDTPIDITNENRKPQDMVELIGNALGVNDYETNMASFWFLDFIALQLLRYESVLDNHGRSVMVSWLAGEMKLIQEKKFSREAFFQEMEDIFIDCSEKLSRGRSLLHWDSMMADNTREVISIEEEIVREPKEKRPSHPKITKRRVSSKSDHRRTPSEPSFRKGTSNEAQNIISNDKDSTISQVDGTETLDVIIEATYNMYGNSFHYALIVAAFVKPVQLHEYTLPLTFRAPRPIKMFEVEKQGDKKIAKSEDSAAPRKGKESKKKEKDNKKSKKKSIDSETSQVAPEPPPPIILTDEEILMKKREFILPLMEANEASSIIAAYREANSQSKNIVGQ